MRFPSLTPAAAVGLCLALGLLSCESSDGGAYSALPVGAYPAADGSSPPAADATALDVTGRDSPSIDPGSAVPAGDAAGGEDTTPVAADPGPEQPPPPPPGVEVLLTGLTVPITDGVSPEFSVEVPPNTVSVTVTMLGPDGQFFSLGSWVLSDGFENVTPNWYSRQPQMCVSCNNRVAAMVEGASASIAPIQPEGRVDPGLHRMTVMAYRTEGNMLFPSIVWISTEVQVWVHAKVRPEPPETGVLDLNLHFSGARGWTAENALDDAAFAAILQSVRSIYGQVGITFGDINTFDVDPGFQVIEGFMGAGNELHKLFETTAGKTEGAVNLLFVDEFTGGPLGGMGMVLGVSGGIPGPVLKHGTVRSGVAIAAREIPGAPAGVDTTMAHELGHYLGLFHTSEMNMGFGAQQHDPLPDTPDNDATYLMFNTGAGNKLSDFQGSVMRSNPWVRHPEVQ